MLFILKELVLREASIYTRDCQRRPYRGRRCVLGFREGITAHRAPLCRQPLNAEVEHRGLSQAALSRGSNVIL